MHSARKFWLPMAICLVLTPICIVLGWYSAGFGHGDYLFAKLLFPIPAIATSSFLSLGIDTSPLTILYVMQYPLYGVLLGCANQRDQLMTMLRSMLGIHLLLALICLLFVDV